MKDKIRSLRIHHINRLKNIRKHDFAIRNISIDETSAAPPISAKTLGRHINAPKICSCFMCGNSRKFFKEKTIQELRSNHRHYQKIHSHDLICMHDSMGVH